jgi:hypothetical protein
VHDHKFWIKAAQTIVSETTFCAKPYIPVGHQLRIIHLNLTARRENPAAGTDVAPQNLTLNRREVSDDGAGTSLKAYVRTSEHYQDTAHLTAHIPAITVFDDLAARHSPFEMPCWHRILKNRATRRGYAGQHQWQFSP